LESEEGFASPDELLSEEPPSEELPLAPVFFLP
jgi:hypothetical protein